MKLYFEKMSVEEKEVLYKNRSGENNSFYGKHHSDKSKELIMKREPLIGERNGMFHKLHTENARRNMRINHGDVSGEKNPNFGKKKSAEEIAQRNETRCKNRLLK